MARKHEFPDPNDRSINNPSDIMDNKKVIAYYNQENPKAKATYVSDTVKTWTVDKANEIGWSTAEFHGNQCLLRVDLEIKK